MISAMRPGTTCLGRHRSCAIAVFLLNMLFSWPISADGDVVIFDVESLVDSLGDRDGEDSVSVREILPDGGIQVLPVRTVEEVVGLQGGVVCRDIGYVTSTGPLLHVRGGETFHTRFYLNGVPMTNSLSGDFSATVSPAAIGSIGFVPGGIPAMYGNVNGGVVDIVTRSGSNRYTGGIEIVTDNLGGSGFDQNWYSAHVGGPVSFLDNAYFFGAAERRWLGDRNPSAITDEVLVESDGRLPNNSQSGWSYHGRFDWELHPKLNLTLTGDYSKDSWQQYLHYFNNPYFPTQIDHTPRHLTENLGLRAKMEHAINDRTSCNLSASYFSHEWVMGDGVAFDDFDAYYRGAPNPFYDRYYLYREGLDMYSSWFDWYVPGDQDTLVAFLDSYWDFFEKQKSIGLKINGEYKRRLGESNAMVAGLDFERQTLRHFTTYGASVGYTSYLVNRYGYDSTGHESDDEDWQNEAKHPIAMGLYLQTYLDFGVVSLSPSVRLDRFDCGALRPIDYSDPLGEDNAFDRSDMTEADAHIRLSPRLAIALKVHDRVRLRASAGQYYQTQPALALYGGWDYFLTRVVSGSFALFGNAQIEPERTRSAVFGVGWELSNDVAIAADAFFRSAKSSLSGMFIINVDPSIRAYSLYSDGGKWDSRGLQLSLNARPSELVSFKVGYTWSRARTPSAYSGSAYVINWSNPVSQPTLLYMSQNHEQRHRLVGQVDVKPDKDSRINVAADLGGGFPYTPTRVYDEISHRIIRPNLAGPPNSERGPGWFNIDTRIERRFKLRSFELVPFVWVKNLLNRKNVTSVYEGTGKPDETGYLETEAGQTAIEYEGEPYLDRYQLLQRNPQHYGNPRQVYFGVRVLF